MSWTLVQNPAKATGTGTSLSLSYGSNTTAGNLLTAEATSGQGTAVTFSETTGSDTWTNVVAIANNAGTAQAIIGCVNSGCAGGAVTVKVAPSSGSPKLVLSIQEWSGNATTTPQETTSSAKGSSISPASGSVSPISNGDLFIGCLCTGTASTITDETSPAWTNLFTNPSLTPSSDGQYFTEANAAAQNATWTLGTTGQWAAVVATFKPGSGVDNLGWLAPPVYFEETTEEVFV